jgi:SAM-dependent methyltransferase
MCTRRLGVNWTNFIYRQSAQLYDLFCAHKDYVAASRLLTDLVDEHAPHAASLLDVACGTGGHLERLASRFDVAGLEQSTEMLELAGRRCPGTELHQGDLTDFDLGRSYDVVTCLFGSVGYAGDLERMCHAIRCMAAHLEPGGLLILEPWLSPESYKVGKITADFIDETDLKASRMYVSELEDGRSVFDIHYLVADQDGVVSYQEQHSLGLFSKREYRDALADAGLAIVLEDGNLFGYGLMAGTKPR